MTEEALLLGSSPPLVGIVSTAGGEGELREPAAIILNAGIVHHVGPNRWTVRLARRLAEQGRLAVRFDHAGVGDSEARCDSLAFERSSIAEVREVMDQIQRRYGTRSFVLLGLCSGAATSILTAQVDERVTAAVLVNPPGGGGDESADHHLLNEGWARRYWSISLLDPGAWWRALSGRIQYRRLMRVLWTQLAGRLRPPVQLDRQVGEVAHLVATVAGRGAKLLSSSPPMTRGEATRFRCWRIHRSSGSAQMGASATRPSPAAITPLPSAATRSNCWCRSSVGSRSFRSRSPTSPKAEHEPATDRRSHDRGLDYHRRLCRERRAC